MHSFINQLHPCTAIKRNYQQLLIWVTIAQTITRKAQGEWPMDNFLGQIQHESRPNDVGSSNMFPMCNIHSAISLIHTPDTATRFLSSAGSTSNYIYASITHTTSTSKLHSMYSRLLISNNILRRIYIYIYFYMIIVFEQNLNYEFVGLRKS